MQRLAVPSGGAVGGADGVGAETPKLPDYKEEAAKGVDEMAKLAQEMVDSVFSFGELGFQEVETSTLPDRPAREVRLHGAARRRRHSDRVGREVGLGQAGDRARLGHRRHPAGVAEARRRLSAIRSSPARRATARATTPACRSTSSPRSR